MRSLWCACPTVIDCYTGSWGPCEMVAGHFSNFYFDLGETLGLKFVRACSNNIGELKEFQNASQSTFLFYLVRSASPHRALCPASSSPARAPVATLSVRVRVCVWQNGEKQETIVGSNIPAIHEYIKANAPKNES